MGSSLSTRSACNGTPAPAANSYPSAIFSPGVQQCSKSGVLDFSRWTTSDPSGPKKLFVEEENPEDKLVGVVVTIYEGGSYDAMFREVKPTTVPGERISTYSISCSDVEMLHSFLASSVPTVGRNGSWASLVEDVRQVPEDSVVFNWECCSECGDHAFPCSVPVDAQREQERDSSDGAAGTPSVTMRFMGFALRSGFTVMCSDFSLKSLIFEWSEEQLGPNPFLVVGDCDQNFRLEFVPADLQDADVPQQLQVVGELCKDQGKAVVSAMSDTIVYTVNPDRKKTDLYDLKVLTIATQFGCGGPRSSSTTCSVGESGWWPLSGNLKKGTAGHVTLTYAEGGQLVTSMGHWIELTRINTSVQSVMRVAQRNFGALEAENFRREWEEQRTDSDREVTLQKWSHHMVSQSAPTRMVTRTKYAFE